MFHLDFRFAGCTTIPFGLFITIMSLSSYIMSNGISCAFKLVFFTCGISIVILSPSSTVYDALVFSLFTNIFPSSINLWIVTRDNSSFCAKYLSILWSLFSFTINSFNYISFILILFYIPQNYHLNIVLHNLHLVIKTYLTLFSFLLLHVLYHILAFYFRNMYWYLKH